MATKTPKAEAEQPHVHAAEQEPADTRKDGELFDKSTYDDPKLLLTDDHGNRIDEIEVSFAGTVKLTRQDAEHVRLIRDARVSRFHDVDVHLKLHWTGKSVRVTPEREDGGGGDRIMQLKGSVQSLNADTQVKWAGSELPAESTAPSTASAE